MKRCFSWNYLYNTSMEPDTKNKYEMIRKQYAPERVRILFVGESRPRSDKFFYYENTFLYRYTKLAFQNAEINFSLEKFKELGCWLYDVCEAPVNGECVSKAKRKELIRAGLPKLDYIITQLKPEFVIVPKKGAMRDLIFNFILQKGYIDGQNAFNLPFPNCGNQKKYQNQLSTILKQIF